MISSAMIEGSVAYLDSGVGGLPYLGWFREKRPGIPVVYLADNQGFPYGGREESYVKQALFTAARGLFARGRPRILVLACNTASVTALAELREMAPCPVVGTVPAIKPAAARPSSGALGILATRRTLNSAYLEDLTRRFAPGRQVERVAADALVRYIEESWLENSRQLEEHLRPAVLRFQEKGVSTVVLGCTHFLHIAPAIARALGKDITLVDSCQGVGHRVLELLDQTEGPEGESPAPGDFLVTDPSGQLSLYKKFARRFSLTWKGGLGD